MCFSIASNKIEQRYKVTTVHFRGWYTVILKVARPIMHCHVQRYKCWVSLYIALTDVSVASQCGSIANVCTEFDHTGSHDLLYWSTWSLVFDHMISNIGSHDLQYWITWSVELSYMCLNPIAQTCRMFLSPCFCSKWGSRLWEVGVNT